MSMAQLDVREMRRSEKGQEGVYVTWLANSSFVKIGRTSNIYGRVNQLQGANSSKIILLCWFRCSSKEESARVEKYLHLAFADHRGSGEHFETRVEMGQSSPVFRFITAFQGLKDLSASNIMEHLKTFHLEVVTPEVKSLPAWRHACLMAKYPREVFEATKRYHAY